MGKDVVYRLPHTELRGLQFFPSESSDIKVLSLHGWLDNAASFINLSKHLSSFSHITLDLAGHGDSKHRPDGSFYHLWDYVLDIVSVLKAMEQSVWLVGHSMGGAVAMLVAAIAPDKVRGLIVLDNVGPLIDSSEARVNTLQRSVNKMLKHRVDRKSLYQNEAEMISARMNGFTKLSEDASRLLVERGAKKENDTWVWKHDGKLTFPSPYRMDEESVRAFIKEIKCPTLVLLANDGVYKGNKAFVERRASQFSWVKLKWLDGSHHFHLEVDTCSAVAKEIQQFIELN
ncbi:alpha/beta hydrolase [Marinomonas sp. C2222]|uniref:Alpha/beta hydrolase n=1 Tax=Marinomonas sargassi TaxID=2984494 RepID=A0ABT2YS54_9GAMM|nr:alpha/beta hydrolase [Marinomonas sargassi]MCV2402712.1 alpha/beta hydrolase [Marinomonas sargassi]